MKLSVWLRKNWPFLIIAVLAVLLARQRFPIRPLQLQDASQGFGPASFQEPVVSGNEEMIGIVPPTERDVPPTERDVPPAPEVEDRLVIRNSWLSLLVGSVRESQKVIIKKAQELGGYMVNSRIDSPLGVDQGTVTVRVPEEKLDETLAYFRGLSLRVVSENLVGTDVTDKFVDIQARLDTLAKTKLKFEDILTKAEKVQDILAVQRELVNLQKQIDRLKGREKYLEKSAQFAKVTVYLATDELALPYAPAQPWRPQVIFKQAVRSLVSSGRSLASAVIWAGVYAVVWLPLLVIFYFITRKKNN